MAKMTTAELDAYYLEYNAFRDAHPYQVWIYVEKLDTKETLPYLHTTHPRFKTLAGAVRRARLEAMGMFKKIHSSLNGRLEVYAIVQKNGRSAAAYTNVVHRELIGKYGE